MLSFALAEVLAEPRGDLRAVGLGCLASAAPQVFSEPGKARGSNGSLRLKLCFLKACHSPDAVLMGMENCGE